MVTAVARLYLLVVTLSTQDTEKLLEQLKSGFRRAINAKLLEQLKSGFKRTINCNKYQSKISAKRATQYLYYLIDPSFQDVK